MPLGGPHFPMTPSARLMNVTILPVGIDLCTANAARHFPVTTGEKAQPGGIGFMYCQCHPAGRKYSFFLSLSFFLFLSISFFLSFFLSISFSLFLFIFLFFLSTNVVNFFTDF